MAITIISQPPFIAPTGNPMLFKIEDTNTDVVFFRVTITEVGTSNVLGQLKVYKTPLTEGNFVDVSKRLDDFTSIKIDNISDLYRPVEGAINYVVEIESFDIDGEKIGSSYVSPELWAISGGGDVLSGYNYDVTDWYMNISQIGVKYADFLTSKPLVNNVFAFQKDFLYFLADNDSGVESIKYQFFYKAGTSTTEVEYITLDSNSVLHRVFTQPNLLATAYGFNMNDLKSFSVALYGEGDTRISKERTFVIDSSYDCSVDKVNMLWENYEGGIDSFTFINPKETKRVDRQTMLLNGYTEPINNVYKSLSSVVNTSMESTYSMTTLPLTDEAYLALSNIVGTKNSYVELGDGTLWNVILTNNSIEVKRRKYETTSLRLPISFVSLPSMDIINRGIVLIAPDDTPNPVTFNSVTGADFLTTYTSNTVMITGINVTVPLTITGGEYRVNSGVWSSGSSIINAGDTLTLRITTTTGSLTNHTATVTVGSSSFTYSVTTKEVFNVPDTVNFTPQTDVSLNVDITSNTITINGINVPIPISISNGVYSKNGGGFTSVATTAVNGDTFAVRHTSANNGLISVTTTFNYGGKTALFTSTTKPYDVVPDDFSFTASNNQAVNTTITSNTITVGGITEPVPISISNGEYRVNVGGVWGSYTSASGMVSNGSQVQLRTTTPANPGLSKTVTLTISSKTGNWVVNTIPKDETPTAFSFSNLTNQELNSLVTSNTVTITGINVPVTVELTAGSSFTQFRINGGTWRNTATTITSGQTLQLRMTTANAQDTVRTATIKVGTSSVNWTARTKLIIVSLNMCIMGNQISNGRMSTRLTLTRSMNVPLTVYYSVHYINNSLIPETRSFNSTIPAGNTSYTSTVQITNASPSQGIDYPYIVVSSSTPANNATVSTPEGSATFTRLSNYGGAGIICTI